MHTLAATKNQAMQKNAQFSKSKIPCLIRHRGGNYYASAKVSGKIIRRSLDTDDFNTAKNRLANALDEMRGAKNARAAGTLGAAIEAESKRKDPSIKERTQDYYAETWEALERVAQTMPENPLDKNISRVNLADLRALMDKYAAAFSPTRYNGCLALIRRTYERAVESGHVGSNLALPLKRVKPQKRKHDLPTANDFAKIVADILAQRKSHSKAAALAVEFLAYTGLRISEAVALQWRDIKKDHLVTRTAKNDDLRQVPLIPAAKALIARMKAAEVSTEDNDPVLLIQRPRQALTNACERLGIDHMRIHDLRHIFATRCIEGGVDMPTLASWLGHKDGGVLAMQVYGHLCEKHSTAMAGRVKA
jgi:integrase